MNQKLSVIIPVYNEEKEIVSCLKSLQIQSYKNMEIIVVDDGSTDTTLEKIRNLLFTRKRNQSEIRNLVLLKQNHLGPGSARNLGASNARGQILIFVDADMTFEKNFIEDLIKPIVGGQTIGTFSKNEMNANANNVWSKCWNINRNWPPDRLIPADYPDTAPVFRAILKSEFDKAGGFDAGGGYTDDWSLSRKLKVQSTVATGAIYYHKNPSTLAEVFAQASWIGKNEFVCGNLPRRLKSLLIYNPFSSILVSVIKSLLNANLAFIIFKPIYDFAVLGSVLSSFFSKSKAK